MRLDTTQYPDEEHFDLYRVGDVILLAPDPRPLYERLWNALMLRPDQRPRRWVITRIRSNGDIHIEPLHQ